MDDAVADRVDRPVGTGGPERGENFRGGFSVPLSLRLHLCGPRGRLRGSLVVEERELQSARPGVKDKDHGLLAAIARWPDSWRPSRPEMSEGSIPSSKTIREGEFRIHLMRSHQASPPARWFHGLANEGQANSNTSLPTPLKLVCVSLTWHLTVGMSTRAVREAGCAEEDP